jgi:ribose transport system substrate-binding protein
MKTTVPSNGLRRLAAITGAAAVAAGSLAAYAGMAGTADAAGPGATAASASGAAAVAAAKKFIAPYISALDPWTGPTSAPPIAKKKTVVFVDPAPSDEACTDVAKASVQIGKLLGWTVKVVDEQNNDFETAVQTALEAHPNGLILNVAEPGPDTAGLKLIAKSKVPSIDFIVGNEAYVANTPGITHIVNFNYALQGELESAEAVIATGGHANIGLIKTLPDSSSKQEVGGAKAYLAKNGGGTISATDQVSSGILFTPALGQSAVAFAQSHASVNVQFDEFDGMAVTTVPALKSAGLTSKVKTISVEGDSANINFIRTGAGQVGDVAPSFTWATWAAFDDLNRIFNKTKLPANDGVPVKLINSSDLPSVGARFNGYYDFEKKYESLWHVS